MIYLGMKFQTVSVEVGEIRNKNIKFVRICWINHYDPQVVIEESPTSTDTVWNFIR